MKKEELLLSGVNRKLILKKVNTAQGFKELKHSWNLLLEQSPNPHIFLTWEWLYTWWEFYSSTYQLFILIISDREENILGIAPLCQTRYSPLRLKALRFLGTEEVCSDHLDFILRRGLEKEIVPIFLKYLKDNPGEWDLLDLTDLREDSSILPFIRAWVRENEYEHSFNLWTICPYALLPESWESFLGSLSSKARKDIKYQLKLAREREDVFYSIVTSKDEVDLRMEELFHLHTKRWSFLGEEGVFQRERFNLFHKRIARLFFDRGWLYLSFLRTNDKLIALYYNFLYSNKIYYYQSGFDPDWRDFSPGTSTIALNIKAAISKKIKEFDFLRGEGSYKYKWTDKNRKNLQVRVWNKNLKSYICRNGLFLVDKAKSLAKKYMPGFAIRILKYILRR